MTLVTIGVPVHNGEQFLEASLKSLVAQTYTNLEILISDNASTDGTARICKALASTDVRIRYIRNHENIGAPANWNSLVRQARGEYFKWASASDLCDPKLIERCTEALEADSSLAVCYGRTQFIDEDGGFLDVYSRDESIDEHRPSERFWHACRNLWLNNVQSGLFRLSMLRATALDRSYPAGDLALMSEVALYGRFKLIPEVLLYRRRGERTFNALKSSREQQEVLTPGAARPSRFVVTRRHLDNLASIVRSPISIREKTRACGFALRFASWDRRAVITELLGI